MTEEDVKKKWCPMSRTGIDGITTNRGADGTIFKEDYCIASECMMWREKIHLDPKSDAFLKEGWCGLAGKP